MPKKKKKQREPFAFLGRSRQRPRLAQGHFVVVECYDPRCGCAPGAVTLAPVPQDAE